MIVTLCVIVLAYTPVQVFQTEQALERGRLWSQDFILAPGDSLKVNVTCLRKVGSCCGPFGVLGDVFLRKGDNVGRATVSEWRGGVLTSVYGQHRAELIHYSPSGGAFAITVENHSGHRTNLYSISASRTPTLKQYVKFDPTFKTDTTYETAWTVETRRRLVREEVVRDTSWETRYDSTLVSVDTVAENVVDEVKHIAAGSNDRVHFDVPADVDRWAYWVGVEEAYSAMKQILGGAVKAVALAKAGPLAAFAAGIIQDLTVSKAANINVGYTLSQLQDSAWVPVVAGGRVHQSYRKMSGPGSYLVDLDNSYSFLTAKTARVQVSAIKFIENYSVTSRIVPVVNTNKVPIYEDYNVNVPHVKVRVAPRFPWGRR